MPFRGIATFALVGITLQNCSLMMVTSYSRERPGPKYVTSTAVVAGEIVKTLCVFGVLLQRHGFSKIWRVLRVEAYGLEARVGRYAVPAVFYTVQNNLWYYAMSNLDSVTAAVTSQMKVPSTAFFSVIILQKLLNRMHVLSLTLLVVGLIVMQLQGAGAVRPGATTIEYYLGVCSMIAACVSSGYAGVYLELLFKQLNADIWIANWQLQSFCLPISIMSMSADWEVLSTSGVFVGWDSVTCLVVLLNALGGFAVSLTMKFADNILKTFAVSLSLVLNCILSLAVFDKHLGKVEVIGIALVIISTIMYGKAGGFDVRSEAKMEPAVGPPVPKTSDELYDISTDNCGQFRRTVPNVPIDSLHGHSLNGHAHVDVHGIDNLL
eukprot:TRINITY_DN16894_c0_g1_i2.p1 TRINITY_DN16894_c0_g1~~TRINITY_DN16894_c0_g1_i2.p1  ORF type:complete len:379 (-),score=39.62 TRINITY_DN16894_c0_g1_i2:125-1261(-)